MKGFKRLSAIFISVLICVFSAVIFTGCDKKEATCKLYAFSTQGGYVLVDDNKDPVEFGDEGSKIFEYTQNSKVKVKAVAETGYVFERWDCSAELDKSIDLTSTELEFNITSAEMVIKARFVLDGSVKYTVTWPEDDSYSIVPKGMDLDSIDGNLVKVCLRDDFKFSVVASEGYNINSIVVKYNGIRINPISDVYTITNITKNVNITVEGVEIKTYKVTADPNIISRIRIVPEYGYKDVVEYKKDYKFTLDIRDDGFDTNKIEVYIIRDVSTNETEVLTAVDGVYTIDNITSNVKICISSIKMNIVYTDTDNDGYTITPAAEYEDLEVDYYSDFKFTVTLDKEYDKDTLVVKANGEQINPINGQYIINYITSDITITVEVKKIKYTVFIPDNISYIITPYSEGQWDYNYEFNGSGEWLIGYGEDFRFTFAVNEGYKVTDSFAVKVGDTEYTPNENGVYTITNITENIRIDVYGITNENGDPVATYQIYYLNIQIVNNDAINVGNVLPGQIQFSRPIIADDNTSFKEDLFKYTLDGSIKPIVCSAAELRDFIKEAIEECSFYESKLDCFAVDAQGKKPIIQFYYDENNTSTAEFDVEWENFTGLYTDIYLIINGKNGKFAL